MDQWWLEALPDELDQGNIFEGVTFAFQKAPPQPLISTSLKHGARGWAEASAPKFDGEHRAHFLHQGPLKHALLLNHGCDIDKPQSKRLIVVPVFPLMEAPADTRDAIQNQGIVANFFLPAVPGIGDAFADLRIMQSVPRANVETRPRLAAMTESARDFLGARLMAFFLRKDIADDRVS